MVEENTNGLQHFHDAVWTTPIKVINKDNKALLFPCSRFGRAPIGHRRLKQSFQHAPQILLNLLLKPQLFTIARPLEVAPELAGENEPP